MVDKHSKVLSLSHPITPRIPLWPGDPPVAFEGVASRDKDGYSYGVSAWVNTAPRT